MSVEGVALAIAEREEAVNMEIDAEQFDRDVARAYALRKEAKAMLEQADEILDQYTFTEERAYPAGAYRLLISKTRRFDEATARRNLTAEQFAQIQVLKADSTLAKKVLGDEGYKRTQREYGWTRKIERYEDGED